MTYMVHCTIDCKQFMLHCSDNFPYRARLPVRAVGPGNLCLTLVRFSRLLFRTQSLQANFECTVHDRVYEIRP